MFYKQLIAIIFAMTLAFTTACSSDADKTQTKDVAANLSAEAPAANTSVFVMENLSTGENPLPDFTWHQDGKTIKFSDYIKGKTVFLNFWGTWCPPCRAEIPHIVELQKEYKDKDFVVVGFALERNQTVSGVQKFVDAKGINYINFFALGSLQNTAKLVEHFGGVQAVPTTFIFNSKGEKVETIVGGRDYKSFKASIEKALKS